MKAPVIGALWVFGFMINSSLGFHPSLPPPAGLSPWFRRGTSWRKRCLIAPMRQTTVVCSVSALVPELSAVEYLATSTRALLGDWQTPLLFSSLAGLSTCVGAAVVFVANEEKVNDQLLSFALSLAASVMVTVSVVSILPESFQMVDPNTGTLEYLWMDSQVFRERCLSIAAGCGLYALISNSLPEPDSIIAVNSEHEEDTSLLSAPTLPRSKRTPTQSLEPNNTHGDHLEAISVTSEVDHWSHFLSGKDLSTLENRRAWRLAVLLFVSLAIHNFPEGLAVAASSFYSRQLGLTTTVAIALHNIPEGVAIAVPCLAARPDSPWLAFALASLSGLAEPMGAIVALFLIDPTTSGSGDLAFRLSMEDVLAFVAGIMTTVALVELFPEAMRHSRDDKRSLTLGTICGVIVMLASENALQQ